MRERHVPHPKSEGMIRLTIRAEELPLYKEAARRAGNTGTILARAGAEVSFFEPEAGNSVVGSYRIGEGEMQIGVIKPKDAVDHRRFWKELQKLERKADRKPALVT